jgi:MFS family permease
MKTALRVIAGVLAGLLVSFILIVLVELFSSAVYPFPKEFGETIEHEEMCLHVERYPNWILAVAALAWAFTAFLGTWIAQRIGNLYSAAIVGLLLVAGLVFNVSMLPYAIWFKIVILIAVPAAIVAGIRWSKRPKAPGAIAADF